MVDSMFSTGFLKIFCPGYGVCFKGAALVMGSLFENLALAMGLPSLDCHRHMYTRSPIGVTPPPLHQRQNHCLTVHMPFRGYDDMNL